MLRNYSKLSARQNKNPKNFCFILVFLKKDGSDNSDKSILPYRVYVCVRTPYLTRILIHAVCVGAQSVFSGVVVVACFGAILHNLKICRRGHILIQRRILSTCRRPILPEIPLMMSMGMIFAMIVDFFWLVNCSKMGVVFLRNDIGIPSESFFAKMERVLASLRVQSYNAKKGIPNFSQICGVSKC